MRITYALLGWLGTAAGALWAAVLYGFVHKEKWAWFWGAVAATIQLLAGFFPAIPAMDSHLPTPTLMVFGLALVLWFGMLLIGAVRGKIIALTFVAGLAYVLSFIDGVAPIAKFTTSDDESFWNGMYMMSQQISWWGAAAWAVFIFAVLKKEGLGAAGGDLRGGHVHDQRVSAGPAQCPGRSPQVLHVPARAADEHGAADLPFITLHTQDAGRLECGSSQRLLRSSAGSVCELETVRPQVIQAKKPKNFSGQLILPAYLHYSLLSLM